MSLDEIVADRDSTATLELLRALAGAASLEDTSVVLQLLEHAKCERGFNAALDSVSRSELGAAFVRREAPFVRTGNHQ